MANENNDASENTKGFIMKLIESLLKLFGVKLGNGGGMPLDQAIKQPGAEKVAENMLEDKMTQWACKQALKIPGLRDIAKDYLNNNPDVKEFAQKVLDSPKLKDFKKDLEAKGLLEQVGLNAKKENASDKQASGTPLEMSSPTNSTMNRNNREDQLDNYPTTSEQNTAPQYETTNQEENTMRGPR